MPVFIGSAWQRGSGQVGYGIGGLFKSLARTIMPMVKSGAKTLGKAALNTGANVLGDVLSGKNVKEAAKSRVNETADALKQKAVNKFQKFQQTGNGKRARTKTAKNTTKKRKASPPGVRSKLVKKRKTTQVQDIFS
jgi:uncharacterized protein YidB (DUF937 family)